MIENWVEVLGLLLMVLVALLAAFWKLLNKAGENKSKYQLDVLAVRGTVLSRDVIPQLIELMQRVESIRMLDRSKTLEQILEKATHGYSLQQIVKRISEINDLDVLYLKAISLAFACAYDLLLAAVLMGISIVWLFVDQYWEYFIPLTIFAGLIILIKSIYNVLQYTRNLRAFIQKDNEMRLGRSMS